MGGALHERTGFGTLERWVEDGDRRCGSLVLMEYFAEYLHSWLTLDRFGNHFELNVLVLGEEVEVSDCVLRAAAILLEVEIEHGAAAATYLGRLRLLDKPIDVSRHRLETDVQRLFAFCLDAYDAKSRVMTWVKRRVKCSPTGAAESGIVL